MHSVGIVKILDLETTRKMYIHKDKDVYEVDVNNSNLYKEGNLVLFLPANPVKNIIYIIPKTKYLNFDISVKYMGFITDEDHKENLCEYTGNILISSFTKFEEFLDEHPDNLLDRNIYKMKENSIIDYIADFIEMYKDTFDSFIFGAFNRLILGMNLFIVNPQRFVDFIRDKFVQRKLHYYITVYPVYKQISGDMHYQIPCKYILSIYKYVNTPKVTVTCEENDLSLDLILDSSLILN